MNQTRREKREPRLASDTAHELCGRYVDAIRERVLGANGAWTCDPDPDVLDQIVKAGRFSLDLQRNQADFAVELLKLTGDKDRAAQILERAAAAMIGADVDGASGVE